MNAALGALTPNATSFTTAGGVTQFDFSNNNFSNGTPGFASQGYNGLANFTSTYTGKINITSAGLTAFSTRSDDGSTLFIDGNLVVNNNFFQGATTRSGSINLAAGLHDITIGFTQGASNFGLQAFYTPFGGVNQLIPNSVLGASLPTIVYGNDVSLSASSTISSPNAIAGLGNLNLTNNSGINLTFSGPGAQFSGGLTVNGGADIINVGAGSLAIQGNFNDGGVGTALTSSGTGSVTLESSGSTHFTATTGGSLTANGLLTLVGSGGLSPIGSYAVTLGSTATSLALSSTDAGPVSFPGAITLGADTSISAQTAGISGIAGTPSAPIIATTGGINGAGHNLTLLTTNNYILNIGGAVSGGQSIAITGGTIALASGSSLNATSGVNVTGSSVLLSSTNLSTSSMITLAAGSGSYMKLLTPQGANVMVNSNTALLGDVSGLNYANVSFGANASFGPNAGSTNLPNHAQIALVNPASGGTVYHAVTDPTLAYGNVADDGTNIYRGLSFGNWSTATGSTVTFTGSASAGSLPLTGYMNGFNVTLGTGGATPTVPTLTTTNSSVGANFTSTGLLTVNNFPNGTNLLTRTGIAASNSPSATNGTTGTNILTLNSVPTGKTADIRNGMFILGSANAVAGSVNIDDQGSFRSDFYNGSAAQQFSFYPTTGTFNVLPGGVVYARGNLASTVTGTNALNSGAFFNWSHGSKLIIYSETGGAIDTSTTNFANGVHTNGIAGNVDYNILWNNGISFTGGATGGVILGDGRRITMNSTTGPATINAGSGIKVANWTTTADDINNPKKTVLLTAPVGMSLVVKDTINTKYSTDAGTAVLQINDTGTYFNTAGDGTILAQVAQTGTVVLTNTVNAGLGGSTPATIDVAAGTFSLGVAGTTTPLTNVTSATPTIGTIRLENTSTTNLFFDSGTVARQSITTGLVANGTDSVSVTRTAGTQSFSLNSVTLNSASNFQLNSATAAVDVRSNLILAGSGTFTNNASTGTVTINSISTGGNTATIAGSNVTLVGNVTGSSPAQTSVRSAGTT